MLLPSVGNVQHKKNVKKERLLKEEKNYYFAEIDRTYALASSSKL
jgi:hypothetical protein